MDRLLPTDLSGATSYPLAIERQPGGHFNLSTSSRRLSNRHRFLMTRSDVANATLSSQSRQPSILSTPGAWRLSAFTNLPAAIPAVILAPSALQHPNATATHYAYNNMRNNPAVRGQPQRYRQPASSQQPLGRPFVPKEIAPSSSWPSNGSVDTDISDVATSSPRPSIGSKEMKFSKDRAEIEQGKKESSLPALRTGNSRPRYEEEVTMLLALSGHAPAQVDELELDPYSTEAGDLPAPFPSPPTLETSRGHWAAYKSLKKGENTSPLPLHATYSIPPPQLYAGTILRTPAATERLTDSSAITPSKAKAPGADPHLKSEAPSTKGNERVERKPQTLVIGVLQQTSLLQRETFDSLWSF